MWAAVAWIPVVLMLSDCRSPRSLGEAVFVYAPCRERLGRDRGRGGQRSAGRRRLRPRAGRSPGSGARESTARPAGRQHPLQRRAAPHRFRSRRGPARPRPPCREGGSGLFRWRRALSPQALHGRPPQGYRRPDGSRAGRAPDRPVVRHRLLDGQTGHRHGARGIVRVGDTIKWSPGAVVRARHEGVGLSAMWFKTAERKGVEIRYDTSAVRLFQDQRARVAGVLVRGTEGFEELSAKAVVLGCGGFEANPEWRARYLGRPWDSAKVRGTRY